MIVASVYGSTLGKAVEPSKDLDGTQCSQLFFILSSKIIGPWTFLFRRWAEGQKMRGVTNVGDNRW